MSKAMNKKCQKVIRNMEKTIAEVKQNGLGDGALIILRVPHEDADTSLEMLILGEPTSAIAALGTALAKACSISKIPLFRVIHLLLKNQGTKKGDEDETL